MVFRVFVKVHGVVDTGLENWILVFLIRQEIDFPKTFNFDIKKNMQSGKQLVRLFRCESSSLTCIIPHLVRDPQSSKASEGKSIRIYY